MHQYREVENKRETIDELLGMVGGVMGLLFTFFNLFLIIGKTKGLHKNSKVYFQNNLMKKTKMKNSAYLDLP